MRLHHVRCHCGRSRSEVEADIDHVRECDCSVCRRRGALSFRVAPEAIRFLTPLADLSVYVWGTGTGADYFCPTCGIMPFRKPSRLTQAERVAGKQPFEGWAINVRCIDDLSIDELPRVRIRGSELIIK
ncbi:GFA family protein [Sphingomonas morindae]|uniref:CENP-V/GFA domain-containing protein n=1 Tax=Sphingomonas morindae TaxID=1541170 RepID=A0ABY4XEH6_9SPHN|nr:hypothetical protein [Sphingomonas morindae]USI75224.1 hypothetical protein LHA26_19755 [Sphingomonas morindae]